MDQEQLVSTPVLQACFSPSLAYTDVHSILTCSIVNLQVLSHARCSHRVRLYGRSCQARTEPQVSFKVGDRTGATAVGSK